MGRSKWSARLVAASMLLTSLTFGPGTPGAVAQDSGSVYFPQTGQTLRGRFLEYWQQNGHLPQQGYPISGEMLERSDTDGKMYTVQYFERAVFELHPENRWPFDVLLSLLGAFEYRSKYPNGAPGEAPNRDPGTVFFGQTGKHLGGAFNYYWQTNGGLAQQGLPISNEFVEISPLDGKLYTVQYFERAVFEYHPESRGTAHEVLLSHLGTFRFRQKYLNVGPLKPVSISRTQSSPRLSDQYLVWNEMTTPPGLPTVAGSGDIMGMDLRTGSFFDVSKGEPGDQKALAISGSVVVWTDNRQSSDGREYDVVAKDLATNFIYDVAKGPANQDQADIAGRSVVWAEANTVTQRLLVRDLGGPTIEITTTAGLTNTSLLDPKISEDYIVWTESVQIGPKPGSGESFVRAYNRRTLTVRTIVKMPGSHTLSGPGYALADRRLIIPVTFNQGQVSQPVLADLDTGRLTPIELGVTQFGRMEMVKPSISGNYLVWSASTSIAAASDIWGMDLRNGKPTLLVTGQGSQGYPVVAGDWLSWQNQGGPHDGLIGAMRLSAAFQTAGERQKALALIPPRKDDYLLAIHMLSPDDGWAVGYQGVIMRYRSGKWELVDSPVETFLNDIEMVSPSEGWIASTLGMLHYTGGRWTLRDDPDTRNISLFAVEMLSPDDGWAVGSRGILRYTGGKWQKAQAPDEGFYSLEMISASEGWAVGSGGVIWHYRDGVWEQQRSFDRGTLTDVDMLSASEGWAVGEAGHLLHYKDGRWAQVPYPIEANALSLDMLSPNEGWLVGRGGGIMRYTGGKWSLVETGIRGVELRDLDMLSPTEGWAVGNDGVILRCQRGVWSVFSR